MNTYSAKAKDVKRDYFVANAEGKILGRLATRIATILAGKHKVIYTPHVDTGDFVIVLNADRIKVTGKKPTEKIYARYSGYPSGQRVESFRALSERRGAAEPLRRAVERMLPRNTFRTARMKNLQISE